MSVKIPLAKLTGKSTLASDKVAEHLGVTKKMEINFRTNEHQDDAEQVLNIAAEGNDLHTIYRTAGFSFRLDSGSEMYHVPKTTPEPSVESLKTWSKEIARLFDSNDTGTKWIEAVIVLCSNWMRHACMDSPSDRFKRAMRAKEKGLSKFSPYRCFAQLFTTRSEVLNDEFGRYFVQISSIVEMMVDKTSDIQATYAQKVNEAYWRVQKCGPDRTINNIRDIANKADYFSRIQGSHVDVVSTVKNNPQALYGFGQSAQETFVEAAKEVSRLGTLTRLAPGTELYKKYMNQMKNSDGLSEAALYIESEKNGDAFMGGMFT